MSDLQARIEELERRLAATGDVRHDVNNLLMGLMGHAELLREAPELVEPLQRKVDAIREQLRRVEEQMQILARLSRLP